MRLLTALSSQATSSPVPRFSAHGVFAIDAAASGTLAKYLKQWNSNYQTAMTDKKCPKCGSKNFQITDYSVTGYIYQVEDGVVTGNGDDAGGKHVRTICECAECGHVWYPRNFDFEVDG